jgi:ribosome-associated protein YbcJ (S4-like RNA binding protein)
MMKPIYIHSEFITLGQALKMINLISSGGEGKHFLLSHTILVDGELERRRGRKLYPNMTLVVDGGDMFEVLREA